MKEHKCIYCGASADLSESDIIPDALTNARITNKNVCRVAHNNRFSDLFESKVIEALSFITNELDIKSSKGKRYAAYDATVTIDGESYKISLQSDKAIFDGRVLKSRDKSHMIGSYDTIVKIAKGENSVQPIDVNQIEIEKTVSINTSIYFDVSMFRMIAKIAYEWYCAKNAVLGYHPEFENIVSYITTGTGDCPVSIIQADELSDIVHGGSAHVHYLEGNRNRLAHADRIRKPWHDQLHIGRLLDLYHSGPRGAEVQGFAAVIFEREADRILPGGDSWLCGKVQGQLHFSTLVDFLNGEDIAVLLQIDLDIARVHGHQHIPHIFCGNRVFQGDRHGKAFSRLGGGRLQDGFADIYYRLGGRRVHHRLGNLLDLPVGDGNVQGKGGRNRVPGGIKAGSGDGHRVCAVPAFIGKLNFIGHKINFLGLAAILWGHRF